MKKVFGLALGILTAIGGFLDIGDLVTNAVVGSRFGLSLAWAVVVGVVGICIFAQMSGRVAAVSGRATFELIRERLGPRLAVLNLGASFMINLMTLTAEVGGVALALQLASSVDYLLWVPFAAVAIWLVIWRVKFTIMENVAGLVGLCLIGFAVGLFLLGPDWGELARQATLGLSTGTEQVSTYWFYAVALFGAAMTPYEVFFFSSGAVEEGWTVKDLGQSRANVLVGFPLGGVLSLAIAGCAAVVLVASADLGHGAVAADAASRSGRRQAAAGRHHSRHRRGNLRSRAGDHPLRRLHDRAVSRLAVGQVPAAGAGRTLPPVDDHLSHGRRRHVADRCRPDPGD